MKTSVPIVFGQAVVLELLTQKNLPLKVECPAMGKLAKSDSRIMPVAHQSLVQVRHARTVARAQKRPP
jgi:hypothetical protein